MIITVSKNNMNNDNNFKKKFECTEYEQPNFNTQIKAQPYTESLYTQER